MVVTVKRHGSNLNASLGLGFLYNSYTVCISKCQHFISLTVTKICHKVLSGFREENYSNISWNISQ